MLRGDKKKRLSMLSPIRKGCEVEVSFEEEGYQGSWYRAILEDNPTKSTQKKLRVRYKTLLEVDGLTPLTEMVYERFIRPVPPESLYDGVVLEEGSVVDAYTRDGWWIGKVVKKIEGEKYSVSFDSVAIVHFEIKELRAHFDWVGSKWVRAKNKQLVKPSLKQADVGTQGKTLPKKTIQQVRNVNGLGNETTREKESSEDKNRKRKREQNLGLVANLEETKAKDTKTMVLPFEKKLPVWDTFKTMETFKRVPQNPHFRPLFDTIESSREMYAVGMMHTFSGLLKDVKDLQLETPIRTLNSLNDSFGELEKHGFDVKAPRSRICKLLSLIDRQVKKMEERKGIEKEIAEKGKKILELQKQKEEADKEVTKMKSCVVTIDQELNDVKLQFQKNVSAPW